MSKTSFFISIKAVEKYLQVFFLRRISKFGKNLVPIYFHFHLITVNVDRVYIYFVNERTQKKHSTDVYVHKRMKDNERNP